jgi:hypothetical protein
MRSVKSCIIISEERLKALEDAEKRRKEKWYRFWGVVIVIIVGILTFIFGGGGWDAVMQYSYDQNVFDSPKVAHPHNK